MNFTKHSRTCSGHIKLWSICTSFLTGLSYCLKSQCVYKNCLFFPWVSPSVNKALCCVVLCVCVYVCVRCGRVFRKPSDLRLLQHLHQPARKLPLRVSGRVSVRQRRTDLRRWETLMWLNTSEGFLSVWLILIHIGGFCSETEHPVDHCQRGTHDCDAPERARCRYTGASSYVCVCLPGFSGDGRVCQGNVNISVMMFLPTQILMTSSCFSWSGVVSSSDAPIWQF